MPIRLADFTGPVLLLAPASLSAGAQTLVADRRGWDTVAFDLAMGTPSTTLGPTTKLVPALLVSDSLAGPWVAPPAADVDAELPEIDSNLKAAELWRIEYLGAARFVLMDLPREGTFDLPICVIAQRGGPQKVLAGLPVVGQAKL